MGPVQRHKVRVMKGEKRNEGKGMHANTIKVSGWRRQWWTQGSKRPRASGLQRQKSVLNLRPMSAASH